MKNFIKENFIAIIFFAILVGFGIYQVYDFDKGTFKDRKSVKEDAEREKREAARRAGGDFRDDLNSRQIIFF